MDEETRKALEYLIELKKEQLKEFYRDAPNSAQALTNAENAVTILNQALELKERVTSSPA